jgi:hypothetical protein
LVVGFIVISIIASIYSLVGERGRMWKHRPYRTAGAVPTVIETGRIPG